MSVLNYFFFPLTSIVISELYSVGNLAPRYNSLNGFYLYEKNGYVVVYENDKKTPYEYTDIFYEELPELLKQEIKNGKYIKNEEELYGFLENYTS